MAENIQRSRGRGQGYKFDRGGNPTEFGPFVGEVMNNVDPVRSGRLQVYIEQFAGDNKEDDSLWRTVSYAPPFYGSVSQSGTDTGSGTFVGNPQSYGMWFTPPDLGSLVLCFFVGGDPNGGFYTNCIVDAGINHMIPAIGASKDFDLQNSDQKTYFADSTQLPVTEINADNEAVTENPKFFDQKKPVHSVVAGIMLQQGLINDVDRGPITSNAQRESPSNSYGIITPGRPVYKGGAGKDNITSELGSLKPEDVEIVGRRGGHSLVMDDGDLAGQDNLVRIRTSKGHQITMSDSGDFFYFIHANGQTWIELGKEGTVDVYSTNSVNIRTEGVLNLHADKDINMYAGENFNIKSKKVKINSTEDMEIVSNAALAVASKVGLTISSDGSVGIKAGSGANINGGDSLNLRGGTINLNGEGGGADSASVPSLITDNELPGTAFTEGKGWEVKEGAIATIVTRAPTHEPYPEHNKGTNVKVDLNRSSNETSDGSAVDSIAGVPANVMPTANPITPSGPAMEQLNTQSVPLPITPANVLTQTPAITNVGPLSSSQVTGLMSSTTAMVGQAPGVITNTSGVGQFGLSISQLEQAGYVKPGTNAQFGSIAGGLTAVLSSPGVWTGKNNTFNVSAFLSNAPLQSQVQQGLLNSGYAQLQASGILTGRESTLQIAGLVQSSAMIGPQSVGQWVQGIAGPQITAQINAITKNAQFSVNLIQNAFGGFGISGFGSAAIKGANNTVSRVSVNAAVSGVIGNPKVPTPDYGGNTTTIDVRQIQQDAKVSAYLTAIQQGKSEAEAQNASAAAGNLAGADALASAGKAAGLA